MTRHDQNVVTLQILQMEYGKPKLGTQCSSKCWSEYQLLSHSHQIQSLLDFLSMKFAFYSCRYYIKFKEFSDIPIHETLTFHTLHNFSYKYHYTFIEKIHPWNFHGIIFIGANVWIFNISWIFHNFSWTKNLLVNADSVPEQSTRYHPTVSHVLEKVKFPGIKNSRKCNLLD